MQTDIKAHNQCIVCEASEVSRPGMICGLCADPKKNIWYCSGCGRRQELNEKAIIYLRQLTVETQSELIIPQRKGLVVRTNRCTCANSGVLKFEIFALNSELN